MKYLILLIFMQVSCFGSLSTMSRRDIHEVVSGNLKGKSRSVEEKKDSSPEIFVRKKRSVIQRKKYGPRSGSLFNLNDPRNILITEKPRGMLDSYLDIEITSNRLDPKKEGEDSGEQLEDELLKALPQLDSEKANPILIKNLKMKVVSQLENGDVLVEASRTSSNDLESNAISVRARVSHDALSKKGKLTSKDLQDVVWNETNSGKLTERSSVGWEDEYTLRWSGFNEARSKLAMGLEEKRKRLVDFRGQLQNEYKSLTRRRVEIAKERARLARERKKIADEKEALKDTIEEKEATILEQQEQIRNLQPPPEGENPPEGEEQAATQEGA